MKASDYRERKEARRSAQPRATLALPSGAEFVVTRPPLEVWIAAGKIPQSFLRASLGADADTAGEEVSGEDTLASVIFLREALIAAVVEPRLVPGTTREDELDPADLDPDDFQFLTNWIMRGCPGAPVRTKGGEVSVDGLARFRQKRPGGGPAGSEPDGETVRDDAEPAPGAA